MRFKIIWFTYFDYPCSAWYPKLTQKLKKKLQVKCKTNVFAFIFNWTKCQQFLIKNLKISTGCKSFLGLNNVLLHLCLNLLMAIIHTTWMKFSNLCLKVKLVYVNNFLVNNFLKACLSLVLCFGIKPQRYQRILIT